MERYICIHGHFYQPPRENPWLEDIEVQDSAYPFHDWNERITTECYAPNTVSRILDGEGRIVHLPNNYAKISFNFGPTLLAWLQLKAPETYEGILAADRMSQKNFSGHGSALAQAYNHMILPLANRRDKYTQVLWGIRDFEFRFDHAPRKACGFQRLRWTWRPWTSWLSWGCASPFWRPIRPGKCASLARMPGWMLAVGPLTLPWPTRSICPRAAKWPRFSTTVPYLGVWPSRACSNGGKTWPCDWRGPFPRSANGHSWCISLRTARPTGITSTLGTWR